MVKAGPHKKKFGKIAFVTDDRLPTEKRKLLGRIIDSLRVDSHLDVIPGDIDEDSMLIRLERTQFDLVLIPWYRYLSWGKVEAFFGLTRSSGPTVVGYFADQVLSYELTELDYHLRAILLDFTNLAASQSVALIHLLATDQTRTGIRPMLAPRTPLYHDSWYNGQTLGPRLDSILSLSEMNEFDWRKRTNAVRICLSAMWSLIFEEGPGKGELLQAITGNKPKAYFQVGMDRNHLLFRLCYYMNNWTPKNALRAFWPDPKRPTGAAQLLLKYADFVRIHTISEQTEVELVVGLYSTAPSERAPSQIHTLWVEPVAAVLMNEIPFDAAELDINTFRSLPIQAGGLINLRDERKAAPTEANVSKDRMLAEAVNKIQLLRRAVLEKENLVRELRMGGVGTAKPLPPPDAESLLDAFQERYVEAHEQIKQLELKVQRAQQTGTTLRDVADMEKKIDVMTHRLHNWIRKLAKTVEIHRQMTGVKKTGTKG